MSLKLALLLALIAASAGIGFGYLLRLIISLGKKGSMELDIQRLEIEARDEAQKIVLEAEEQAKDMVQRASSELRERENRTKSTEDRLVKKEELLDRRQGELSRESEALTHRAAEVAALREKAAQLAKERQVELARAARLSPEEAKAELMRTIEREEEEDFIVRMRKLEKETDGKLERRAQEILTSAIQRLSSSIPDEMMATAVSLPSDELKGKIIGKEGRNIKAFERATGVEVIVDDTPNSITLSSFDPVRRAVAKLALDNLIADGRIQPAKIEDFVGEAKAAVNSIIKDKGEEAALAVEIYNLDPKLLAILGRLHFRTSYSQNVLAHSVEMAHLAGMIASEVGANVQVAKAGALLHDIGKAFDHEVQGTHVEIGRRILQKFGVSEEVVKAMQAHHGEYPYETLESVIVQTADAISGGRPGARRDNLEHYLKRLQDLEAIATSFAGVEKAYALQAGREIRVFVTPEKVGDLEARKLARDIATRIEKELKYPGEIKVNVIREARSI
ncbi:ribonuclease Y, partial [Candidatus Parcubacteria bacterium]|nr:ribonuclease Y [Candidatus Parcubacteria bacterium]